MQTSFRPVLYAILAAACYGISAPFSKLLLYSLTPTFLAALLYLGAGAGMLLLGAIRKDKKKEARITKQELPYVIAMVALDIAAPISLMAGLNATTPATVSLLNNFEIVATAMIALIVFHEAVGKRMWLAILFITLGSMLLTVEDLRNFSFSPGALLVLLACICWGLENNCTRKLSLKSPTEIVTIKGFGSGLGSLIIAISLHQAAFRFGAVAYALLLGFVAYGLSITFYILAQRSLGAARTSAYYAFAPFIGAALSFAVFREVPAVTFLMALPVMLLGAYFAAFEKHSHMHVHASITHDHRHSHDDTHHTHTHIPPVAGEHTHEHTHEPTAHKHPHTPDIHHLHPHKK